MSEVTETETKTRKKKKPNPKAIQSIVGQRRAYNLALRQEAMRQQLSDAGLLGRIERIQQELIRLDEELTPTQVARLAKASDNCFRLLNKILPDLKSHEIVRRTEEVLTIEQVASDQRDAINQALDKALGLVKAGGTPLKPESVSDNNPPSPRQQDLNDLSTGDIVEGDYEDL